MDIGQWVAVVVNGVRMAGRVTQITEIEGGYELTLQRPDEDSPVLHHLPVVHEYGHIMDAHFRPTGYIDPQTGEPVAVSRKMTLPSGEEVECRVEPLPPHLLRAYWEEINREDNT